MKKLNFLFFLLLSLSVYSQPQYMNYQGVARNLSGDVISNRTISLQIHIIPGSAEGFATYTEIHQINTSKFGVFNIHIGDGIPVSGSFSDIEWASDNHFVKVEMDIKGGQNFKEMGTTQLLSVPYAFHAQTAGSLVNNKNPLLKGATKNGVPSQNWSLFGNSKTNPEKDKLGTTDKTDLVFVTDNQERLRITSDGKLLTADGVGMEIGGNFKVHGDSTYINKDLYVGRNVHLNVNNKFDPMGYTINHGNFKVADGSNTLLTGELKVDGITELESSLTVEDQTILRNNLFVNGSGQFDSDVSIEGSFSINTDKFTVESQTGDTKAAGNFFANGNADIGGDLQVDGNGQISNLKVIGKGATEGEHVALFENTNGGSADGIKIKLGKKTANNGLQNTPISTGLSINEIEKVKNLIDAGYSGNKTQLLGEIVAEGLVEDAQTIGGLTLGVGNHIVDFINSKLGLPRTIVPNITVFPGFSWSVDLGALGKPGFSIPSESIGPYNFPAIPDINLSAIGVAPLNIEDPGFWGIPNIDLSENVNNPLSNSNEFIRFADMDDKKMGSIRAQSIEDWSRDYLNPIFLWQLRSAIKSTLDKKHARYHFKGKIFEAMLSYTKIGVEYSSGNGDYAEWLRRLYPDENISAGDIVAVKGGKITKNLEDAEQVMAVSSNPIMLGNEPPEEEIHLGNSIAFMGQIPVKVMGTVQMGDYVVGKGDIKGYGIAVHPDDMTIEDYKYVVGRAWEDHKDDGPKMINTVIGVHNGDYLNILKSYQEKFKNTESRLEALEAKVDMLTSVASE
ncbi:MAG: hypothetical protein ACOC2M_01570 [bacterium]